MTPALWFSLLTATLVVSFTPGAGAINTMSNSLTLGWRRSIWGVLGQQLALLVYVVVTAAGVGVLVARSPILFNLIRYLGVAYLLYLGLRLILAKPEASLDQRVALARSTEPAWSIVQRGFWVNILNPKAIVFFLAFIPQFIRLDQPLLPQYLILIATVLTVDILVMWFFFAAAAKPFRHYTSSVRGQRRINTVFGLLFVGVAGLLALMH